MATLTVHPEHVDGLRALIEIEFESACEVGEVEPLRELIELGDELGWEEGAWQTWRDSHPVKAPLSSELLDKLTAMARQVGNERLSDIYNWRASGRQHPLGPRGHQLEREARSMLAWREHMQGQKVAS